MKKKRFICDCVLSFLATALVAGFSFSQAPGRACVVTPFHEQYYQPPDPDGARSVPAVGACIPIYVETDKYTYDQFGQNMAATRAWAQNIVTQAAYIFADEGISIYLSELYVATTPEWSDTLYTAGSVLNIFAQVRQNAPNGRLKHFITRRFMEGGVAWLNVLCANFIPGTAGGPYAVSTSLYGSTQPYPNYGWNVYVFAHEIGHNIGSRHTHACVWGPNNNQAIDDCWGLEGGPCNVMGNPSTIMSYCHIQSEGVDFQLGFGPLPGNLIRQRVAQASCTLSCTLGCPDLITLGGDIIGTYRANEIRLFGATTVGDVTLNAPMIEIDAKGLIMGVNTIGPVFTTLTKGCQ